MPCTAWRIFCEDTKTVVINCIEGNVPVPKINHPELGKIELLRQGGL